jgi:hypothetical protein
MADMFFDRFTAAVSDPVPADAAAALPHLDSPDPAIPGPAVPVQPGIMPVPPATVAIPIWALIPKEMFGLPIVAIIGIVLYVPIFVLIFKAYVFG